jgi:predicted DNA-binding transcriptional regulator AlpA
MRFLCDRELEQLTGIKAKTFRNWRSRGKGPRYTKLGRIPRYEIQDVEAWIRSCPVGGGQSELRAVAPVGAGKVAGE